MVAPLRKILFVTSFHPGARGYIGAGEAISAQTIRRLRDEGAEVDVLTIAPRYQHKNPISSAWSHSYTEIPASRWTALMGIVRNLCFGAILAPWFFTRVSPSAIAVMNAAINRYQSNEIWLDFPSSLGFVQHVKNLPVHYFVHDVVSQNIMRSPLKRLVFPWVKRVEASLLGKVSQCYLLSTKDEELLRHLQFNGVTDVWGVQAIGVGEVDGSLPIASVLEKFGSGPNLVFFGNMGRMENSRSVIHFAIFKWRKLRRVFPTAQLWVIGLAPGPVLRGLGRFISGLKVTGPVDDPAPAFQAATLCIAPLLYGAGVKVKVLQMLEAGATVISTPIGAEGIDVDRNLIVVEYDELVSQVIRHLQNISLDVPGRFPKSY
jgi:hypothetical protein